METIQQRPSIFRYTELPAYLAAMKNHLAATGRASSYSELAEKLGFDSRTKAKKLFTGQLTLSKLAAERLAQVLELGPLEKDYLELARRFTDVTDSEAVIALYRKMTALRKAAGDYDPHELEESEVTLLDEWYYLPLLYYLDLKAASSDPFQILRAFHGQLSLEQVQSGIQKLLELGLIRYTPEGKLEKVHSDTSLLDGLPRPIVKRYHQIMIDKAKAAIQELPLEKRLAMSATIPIRQSVVPILKERVAELLSSLNRDFSTQDGDSIYQLNVQMFRLASLENETGRETPAGPTGS